MFYEVPTFFMQIWPPRLPVLRHDADCTITYASETSTDSPTLLSDTPSIQWSVAFTLGLMSIL